MKGPFRRELLDFHANGAALSSKMLGPVEGATVKCAKLRNAGIPGIGTLSTTLFPAPASRAAWWFPRTAYGCIAHARRRVLK